MDFCCRHEWVVEVHRFVRTWNNTILASWRGRPTETIEVSIQENTLDSIYCHEIFSLKKPTSDNQHVSLLRYGAW